MANINTCCADRPCQYKRICEVSYLDHLISLYRDISADTTIGVDAGMAGFSHNKPDYSDDEWHGFCERTSSGDAWMTEDGFYSSSGYGDGEYGVFAYKHNGEITALEIRFF